MNRPENIEVEFYSSIESLRDLESIFISMCKDLKIETDLLSNIKLCFYESVTNAIKHGNKFDATKKINIKRELKDNSLIFYIRDEGQGFDIEKVENPLEDANIKKPCGRGVFFLKHFCQNTIYCNEKKVLKLEFEI